MSCDCYSVQLIAINLKSALVDQMTECEMYVTCNTHRRNEKRIQKFVTKPGVNIKLRRHKWKCKIEMDVKGIQYEDGD
jgi:hypothetical protein